MNYQERQERLARGNKVVKYGAAEEGGDEFTVDYNDRPMLSTREQFERAEHYRRKLYADRGVQPSWDECAQLALEEESNDAASGRERYRRRQEERDDSMFTADDLRGAMGLGTGVDRYAAAGSDGVVADGSNYRTRKTEARVIELRKQLRQRGLPDSQRRALLAELNYLGSHPGGDRARAPKITQSDNAFVSQQATDPLSTAPTLDTRLGIDFSNLPLSEPWVRPVVEDKDGKLGVLASHEYQEVKKFQQHDPVNNTAASAMHALGYSARPIDNWYQDEVAARRRHHDD
jgi:hypothetical protein